jgi:HAD superfamily hydrolase (TIGR01549 family)
MAVLQAVVFDLDDTLLDTSSLRSARQKRDWGGVKAQLDEVQPFRATEGAVGAEAVPAALRAQGMKVGVVTHSPRWYAEALLGRFGIQVDAMITGSDPFPPKPDPTSLRQIAADLGVEIASVAYVGDEGTDVAAAAAAGATSVGACWSRQPPEEWRRWWPDVALARPEHLADVDRLSARRPLAEVVLASEEPAWHWGTLMRLEPHVLACARYFTPEDVARHPGHAPSALVLQAKEDEGAARRVADVMSLVAERPSWKDRRPELIVSVPPRPGQEFDRFDVIRQSLAGALKAQDGKGNLTMEFEVADYKGMVPDARRAANKNRFRSKPLQGESILLVDDVITSGSQTQECQRALIGAGAREVTVLVFAATQNRLPEACPVCGAYLRVYRGRRGPFIGCPSFFTTGCRYTRDIDDQPT